MLSGAGLYYSQSKSSDVLPFYQKRLKRVVIPWLTLSLPYWLMISVYYKHTIGVFFADWSGITFWTASVSTTWYISLILLLYLAYPLIFRMQKRMGILSVIALAVLMILVNLLLMWKISSYYEKVSLAIARIPSFLIGSAIGNIVREKKIRRCRFWCTPYLHLAVLA